MALARSTDFTLLDYSEEIQLLPKVWSLVSGMNLFDVHNISTTLAQVERVQDTSSLIPARLRGGERNYIDSENAETVNFNVPFFPLDRQITAADIQGFRQYGEGNTSKTVMSEVARVMARIKRAHAQLREKAFMEAIQGRGYGTTYNYYTSFGVTPATADVDFTDLVTDPSSVIEAQGRREIVRQAQDGADSHASYRIIAICGEEWFSAFIAHPEVEEAYKYYESQQEPLRKRLGMQSEDDSVRVFKHKGVTYIEDLSPNIANLEAYILPMDVPNMFRCYYSPADDLEYANTPGQEIYLWYKESRFNRDYKVESETSMLPVLCRPELVIKSTATV